VVSPFTPMHTRAVLAEDETTWTDTAHLTVIAATTLQIMGAMGFAGAAFGKGVPELLRGVAGDDAGGRRVDRNAEERGRSEPPDAVERGV